MASVRRGDRSAASQPRMRSSAAKALRRDETAETKHVHRWVMDAQGNISNFDMKTLRNDILSRLQTGANLYTLEECRMLIVHITRVATRWQEDELAKLMYLSELTTKVLPGRQVVYQFPPSAPPPIPFCTAHSQMHDNPLFKITKVVEELNRAIVRMIDELWCNRRERLLLAARMLRDLEEAIPDAN
uniref:Uncharacterized protein n=1 Tax=Neobodo designis TaxID=312471 RepID=A0A7S1M957_NEODS|mmetsp:Transcript_3640/g.11432  ORF Transcript_3640/g.11432 Transcript_3640/m.11432 type:complete len:187 (+) Transcript_3640:33-593(+)|eukprot:CAMPEP_0174855174 /NCGR_PEP_ID=MMETSP1114-20130205/32630_1 /TAXON_ID=312471 /ORGANISM="Neobodo designis, Strain CCAP 1951/1" /LENGTH=186 /DNA_ID=CAMNT_0016089901 /DNA_START=33 /DNA_END=593 /DNA_ORIENTATION=-